MHGYTRRLPLVVARFAFRRKKQDPFGRTFADKTRSSRSASILIASKWTDRESKIPNVAPDCYEDEKQPV